MELGLNISLEKEDDQILVIQDENLGIKNLVIGCADPILARLCARAMPYWAIEQTAVVDAAAAERAAQLDVAPKR